MARDLTSRIKAARHAVALARRLLAEHGPLHVKGDEMFAGATLLNGDESIVDAVYEETLFGCTIFLGPVRIATRATAKGTSRRALYTRANDMIIAHVLEGGEVFAGQTETLGKSWAIVYEPLDDAQGHRIGMIAGYRELLG